MSSNRVSLMLLCLFCASAVASPVFAQDDLEDLDDLEEDGDDDGAPDEDESVPDSQEIYEAYKREQRGESAAEELDAWRRYLDLYSKTEFKLEIEKRIKALEEAAYRELEEDDSSARTGGVDAKDQEMLLREPALISMSPNTRRRIKLQALWGFSDYLNYELSFEWAFLRKLSAFATVRHTGRGLGAQLQAGAKYALVKDVRTGVILTGGLSIAVGFNPFDRVNAGLEPYVGFGWIASPKFQVQTSVVPYIRLDRPRLTVLWDVMAVVSPTPVVSIYLESKQKHSFATTELSGTKYLGFHHAGIGAKIFPNPNLELTIGANVPYAWERWKDYRYFGVHAGVAITLDKKKS